MINVISFFVAYFGSRIIFSVFGFNYNLFSDSFDLVKFIIDLGVFIVLFGLSRFVINKSGFLNVDKEELK